ncbi:MAG: ABC transporter ATP-binding protein [Solirubrobacteraceae bacterium]
MASIELGAINKVYPNGFHAVHDLDISVADGEFMVLVGPSGCGKTTALRMVAGLEEVTSGTVRIGERDVTTLPARERDIAMVFQNYALYPHLTVAENIGFALSLRKLSKDEIRRRVQEAADVLSLTEWLERKPAQLSGGQRQRVAMGRAIVREPAVFLMDEPLSNLDAKLRVQMRAEVARIQRRLGVATMYVTHDQTEAMTMGDRVVVLSAGLLQQCDQPQVLYDRPDNLFVAGFMGSPAMNLYEATVSPDVGSLKLGSQTLVLPAGVRTARPGLSAYADAKVAVGMRPENLALAHGAASDGAVLAVDTELVEALGSEQLLHFTIDAHRIHAPGVDEEREIGEVVAGIGVARVEPERQIKPGDRVPLAVRPELMHFFDPATGMAIRS